MDNYQLKEETCCVCGRAFIPAVEHIYNQPRNGKVYHICRYKCFCEFNRKYPQTKRRRMK